MSVTIRLIFHLFNSLCGFSVHLFQCFFPSVRPRNGQQHMKAPEELQGLPRLTKGKLSAYTNFSAIIFNFSKEPCTSKVHFKKRQCRLFYINRQL